jgi:hypothetical protein
VGLASGFALQGRRDPLDGRRTSDDDEGRRDIRAAHRKVGDDRRGIREQDTVWQQGPWRPDGRAVVGELEDDLLAGSVTTKDDVLVDDHRPGVRARSDQDRVTIPGRRDGVDDRSVIATAIGSERRSQPAQPARSTQPRQPRWPA